LRIALFTPYSPEIGGGSAQLRSHLRDLSDLDIRWYYLAAKPALVPNENWKWIGEPLSFGELISDLSARSGVLPGSRSRVREIVRQIDADLFWVVGHYEGISVAAELCAQRKPVHLTIHDDPFGTWMRSERYRWFQPLLRRTFPDTLRRARSVDVTSWGMRNLYREKYGVPCFSVYLHVPRLPELRLSPEPRRLTVGHIGTLYSVEPFRKFIAACKGVAAEQRLELKIVRVGSSAQIDAVATEDSQNFVSVGELAERDAVGLLASCDLCYAMYPAGRKYELFRQTSLPIKLSTYVQAQRPIFAHSPLDSGLARIVGSAKVGVVCSSQDESEIYRSIRETLLHSYPSQAFEILRRDLMGPGQIQQLKAALLGGQWRGLPEGNFRSND
jgi:glycosyltransferase involved in cell wall biosynthesis